MAEYNFWDDRTWADVPCPYTMGNCHNYDEYKITHCSECGIENEFWAQEEIKMKKDEILQKAVETINRPGSAAQDCQTCAHQRYCTAYTGGDSECRYKWIHEAEAKNEEP